MNWAAIGAGFGFLGVALGAFGAHALEGRVTGRMLEIYHTATQYQMYHALALVALGALGAAGLRGGGAFAVTGWCWTAGIVVFSGSLYALALTETRWLGAITPIGGTLFLVGWATLAWQAWKSA